MKFVSVRQNNIFSMHERILHRDLWKIAEGWCYAIQMISTMKVISVQPSISAIQKL